MKTKIFEIIKRIVPESREEINSRLIELEGSVDYDIANSWLTHEEATEEIIKLFNTKFHYFPSHSDNDWVIVWSYFIGFQNHINKDWIKLQDVLDELNLKYEIHKK